jgi:hypothetical protein
METKIKKITKNQYKQFFLLVHTHGSQKIFRCGLETRKIGARLLGEA